MRGSNLSLGLIGVAAILTSTAISSEKATSSAGHAKSNSENSQSVIGKATAVMGSQSTWEAFGEEDLRYSLTVTWNQENFEAQAIWKTRLFTPRNDSGKAEGGPVFRSNLQVTPDNENFPFLKGSHQFWWKPGRSGIFIAARAALEGREGPVVAEWTLGSQGYDLRLQKGDSPQIRKSGPIPLPFYSEEMLFLHLRDMQFKKGLLEEIRLQKSPFSPRYGMGTLYARVMGITASQLIREVEAEEYRVEIEDGSRISVFIAKSGMRPMLRAVSPDGLEWVLRERSNHHSP